MSQTLKEVTKNLKDHQRYVAPVIRDLDTGRAYTVKEVNQIPKGVDPSVLSPNARRVDLGELICRPVMRFIPKYWHPNSITMINHCCNWALLVLALICDELPYHVRVVAYIICAILNFLCMMLDCLDGMHARATSQCSRMGELLDHWLDAVHVPLVVCGIGFSLKFPDWALFGNIALSILLYNAQLMVYHHQRVFVQTSGVEAQIGTSLFYLMIAGYCHLPADHTLVRTLSNLVCYSSLIVTPKLAWTFISRFDRSMVERFIGFCVQLFIPGMLYLMDYIGIVEMLILCTVISWRVTGCYVMHSILQRPYQGFDWAIMIWEGLILWSFFFMEPLPVSAFYQKLLPFVAPSFPFHHLTVQRCLPYFAYVHIAYRNVAELLSNYKAIKKLD